MATLLLCLPLMRVFVPFNRRFLVAIASAAVLLLINGHAEAQGIGFQGGVTVDPEQGFFGTHFETRRAVSEFPVQAGHRRRLRRRFFPGCAQHRIPLSHSDRPVVGRVSGRRTGGGVPAAERSARARTPARSSRSASRTKTDSSPISSLGNGTVADVEVRRRITRCRKQDSLRKRARSRSRDSVSGLPKQRQHFEDAGTHSLAGGGDAGGMNQRGRLDAARVGDAAQHALDRRFVERLGVRFERGDERLDVAVEIGGVRCLRTASGS